MQLYRFGEVTFSMQESCFRGPKGEREVRRQVAELFQFLVNGHPLVISQKEIIEHIWPDTYIKESAVAQLILELRQALEQVGGDRKAVTTVPRKGYSWNEEGEWLQESKPKPTRSLWKWLVPCSVLLIVFGWMGFQSWSSTSTHGYSMALTPFINSSSDPEYTWIELGLPDMLTQILSEDMSPGFTPIGEVLKVSEDLKVDFQNEEDRMRLQRALGVDVLIQTTIEQVEDQFQLHFRFHRPDGDPLEWTTRVSRPWDVASALAEGIRRRLGLDYDLPRTSDMMHLDEFSTEAFANGLHLFNLKDFARARPIFEVVLNRNPGQPHAMLYAARCALKLSDYEACQTWTQQVLDQRQGSAVLNQMAQHLLAELFFNQRDYPQALAFAEPLVNDLTNSQSPAWDIKVLWLLGSIHKAQGNTKEADECYQDALDLATSHRLLSAEAQSLWYVASVNHLAQSNLPLLQRALDIAGGLGNDLLRAKCMNAIALLLQSQQEHKKARSYFEQALELRRKLQDQRGIGLGLLYLGNVESRFDPRAARSYFQEALAVFEQTQDAWNRINTYIYLGHLEHIVGDFDAAIDHLERALEIARSANDYDAYYYIRFNQVATELRRQDIDRARSYIREIRSEPELPPHKESGVLCLEGLCAYLQGDLNTAVQKMDQAKRLEGNGWHQGSERYYQILVEAQIKGEKLPLPIQEDAANWLFD